MQKRTIIAGLGVAAVLVAAGTSGAVAGSLITGKDVKNESLTGADIKDGRVRANDLSSHVNALLNKKGAAGAKGEKGADGTNGIDGKNGAAGVDGKNGKDGKDGVSGLYYRTALYGSGYDPTAENPNINVRVNAGAIATVKCTNTTDVAIAGGVQILGLGVNAPNTPVSSSFPGRYDWDNNKPFDNRLDGWIVQFGGNPDHNDPLRAKVWVLCAPAGSLGATIDTIAS